MLLLFTIMLKERLTRENVLSKVTEEEIFNYYLNITVNLRDKYTNPLRSDATPSCSFFISDRTNRLVFNDIARKTKYDCFDIVMTMFKVSYGKSLDIVWHDLVEKRGLDRQVIDNKLIALRKVKTKRKVQIKRKTLNNQELSFWTMGKFAIDSKILGEFKTWAVDAYWVNDCMVANNCKMTFAYLFDNGAFQLYFPTRKKGEMRFDNPTNVKYGGTERVNFSLNYVVITKSNKDSIYLSLFGVNNFFIINEAIVLNQEFMDSISHFDYIFTLFDNDRTGRHLSWQYRKQYQTIPLFVAEGSDFAEYIAKVDQRDVVDQIEQLKYDFNI